MATPINGFIPLQSTIRERENLPNVVCDYRATDICNPGNPPLPCCERPEVTGTTTPASGSEVTGTTTPASGSEVTGTTTPASGVMVVSSLLLMVAMNIATLLL